MNRQSVQQTKKSTNSKVDLDKGLLLRKKSDQVKSDISGVGIQSQLKLKGGEAVNSGVGFDFSKIPVRLNSFDPIQTKLNVGQSEDRYEQEADRVAEQVVKMSPGSQESANIAISGFPGNRQKGLTQNVIQPKAENDTGVIGASSDFYSDLKVNKGNGKALDGNTRLSMESAFGSDFSQVKVHTGSHAADLCQQIQAKAFTKGNYIYFGQRQYNPRTTDGKRLLAHELTHVKQNQNVIQRDPVDAAEEEKITKLKSEIASKFGLKGVEDGDKKWTSSELSTTKAALAMIPAADIAALKDVLLKRVVSLGGSTAGQFSASQSVNSTSVTNNFTIELADLTFSGKDIKRIIIQEVGHAIATLKLRTADAAEEEKITKLKSEIASKFGLKGVEDGDKKWASSELSTTKEALAMIPAADIAALKDVLLKRVVSLGGSTAGQFSASQSVNSTSVTNNFTIELADLTFSGKDIKRIIIHEVGHAIATHKLRTASFESHTATADFNSKVDATNAAGTPFNKANDEMNLAVVVFNDKIKEFNAADSAEQKILKPDVEALKKDYLTKKAKRASLEKIHKTKKDAETAAKTKVTQKEKTVEAAEISAIDLATIKSTADSAKTSHDSSLLAVQNKVTETMKAGDEAKAYFSALQAVSTSVNDFFAQTKAQSKNEDEVDALVASVNSAFNTRDGAAKALQTKDSSNTLQPVTAVLEKVQNDFFEAAKAHSLAHERNKRVQNFVHFVTTNNIMPITDYAQENWPHKPEEFYAEAYSFWVSKSLAAVSTVLDKWFNDGLYKK